METQSNKLRVFQRVCEVDSAIQLNWVRLCALLLFFGVHITTYYAIESPSDAEQEFHRSVTWLTGSWLLMTLAVFFAYCARYLPPHAKYFSTVADIALLTATGAIGNMAESSVVVIYFVIITSALLRFSSGLIGVATLGSILGYLCLLRLSDPVWFDENHAVPLTESIGMLLAMSFNGLVCWQVSRNVQRWIMNNGPATEMHRGEDVGSN